MAVKTTRAVPHERLSWRRQQDRLPIQLRKCVWMYVSLLFSHHYIFKLLKFCFNRTVRHMREEQLPVGLQAKGLVTEAQKQKQTITITTITTTATTIIITTTVAQSRMEVIPLAAGVVGERAYRLHLTRQCTHRAVPSRCLPPSLLLRHLLSPTLALLLRSRLAYTTPTTIHLIRLTLLPPILHRHISQHSPLRTFLLRTVLQEVGVEVEVEVEEVEVGTLTSHRT